MTLDTKVNNYVVHKQKSTVNAFKIQIFIDEKISALS